MKIILADILKNPAERETFRKFGKKHGVDFSNKRIGCALYTEIETSQLDKWARAYITALETSQYRFYNTEHGLDKIYSKIKGFLHGKD